MNLSNENRIKVFAPATVANVSCGFDIMGFAIEGLGDIVHIQAAEQDEIIMRGPYGHLIPAVFEKNTAGVAIQAYRQAMDIHQPVSVILEKNMPLGSGMGSSASSSAAAVFGINHLLNNKLSLPELIPFAMEGERLASGSAHADNVAPALLGGFVLIRSYHPLDILSVPCSPDLYCTVVHPHIELHTADARRVLQREIPMANVASQTANTAGFMLGLLTSNFDVLGRSMNDLLAEPKRIELIPGFSKAKEMALSLGAIGCGISGSGPSIFALCCGDAKAQEIAAGIQKQFLQVGLASEAYVSTLQARGTRILTT